MTTTPDRYRKKPVEVWAIQYNGSNRLAMEDFTGPYFSDVDPDDRGDDPEIVAEVFDVLHSTWVGVHEGDWIIKGVQGEFYPCNPDVFEATYVRAEGSHDR